MKTMHLIMILKCCMLPLVLFGENAMGGESNRLSIYFDTSGAIYHVQFDAASSVYGYDKSALEVPTAGLCPRGVVAYLAGEAEAPSYKYSSSWMSSSAKYKRVFEEVRTNTVSDSYPVSRVLVGFDRIWPDKGLNVTKIKLEIHVECQINGSNILQTADTGWVSLPESIRDQLRQEAGRRNKKTDIPWKGSVEGP